ncbi:hypothetical protein O6H91_04G049200 [Diphasiastrum complanatum]|uniref:Uncharacterized protein n=1 Tax=Diphasiastrum complanatum TaxID=34168 RepID=A0ACC2DWL8_DIPCM|nr:hypothetical protein O6H91_04G049200 [Diphasiastrum complanatum]
MTQQQSEAGVGGKQALGDTTFTKVFVGGLAWETQRETMRLYFEKFGDLVEAVIIADKNTGRSKGYGFVTFRDAESARRACVNATPIIDGRRTNCNLASLGLAARPRSPFLQGTVFRPSSIPFAAPLPTATYNNWPAPTYAQPGSASFLFPSFPAYPPVCHYGYPAYSIDYACPQYNAYAGLASQFYGGHVSTQPLPAYSAPPSYGVQGAHMQYGVGGAGVSIISTTAQHYPEGLQAIPTMPPSSGLMLSQPAAITSGLNLAPTQSFALAGAPAFTTFFPVGATKQAVG